LLTIQTDSYFHFGNNCQRLKCYVQNMHMLQMIAESRPDEKETIVKVIVNLINQNN